MKAAYKYASNSYLPDTETKNIKFTMHSRKISA